MPSLRDQIDGREFDWFAIDVDGSIGHFSSAGFGLVPIDILERFEEADVLPEQFLGLPIVGEAIGHLKGNIADWLEMARRGLYSFDWNDSKAIYCRAATPQETILFSALPVGFDAGLPVIRLPAVCFRDLVEFSPKNECACL
jgi:hypothetical protein